MTLKNNIKNDQQKYSDRPFTIDNWVALSEADEAVDHPKVRDDGDFEPPRDSKNNNNEISNV